MRIRWFTARAVTLNYTYQFVVLGGFGNFGTVTLNAQSVMRTEAQAAP